MKIKQITMIAVLAAVAIVGRTALIGLPNIQPATFLIIVTGVVFGWRSGSLLGILVALISGILSGLGYWTPFQIAAWGMVGLISGFIPRRPIILIGWSILSAFMFGLITSLSMLVILPFEAAAGFYLSGFMFDGFHAIGNLVFLLFAPIIFKVFDSYGKRNGLA